MNAIDTMKLSEFEKLLKSKDWKRRSDIKTLDIYEDEDEDEYGERQPVTRVYGLGEVESTHENKSHQNPLHIKTGMLLLTHGENEVLLK